MARRTGGPAYPDLFSVTMTTESNELPSGHWPVHFLNTFTVVRVASPDTPGDFAGGHLDVDSSVGPVADDRCRDPLTSRTEVVECCAS